MIQRFGPPSEERHNEILFGDEKTRYLKAAYPCWIQLEDKELAKRLRDTYEQKERDERSERRSQKARLSLKRLSSTIDSDSTKTATHLQLAAGAFHVHLKPIRDHNDKKGLFR